MPFGWSWFHYAVIGTLIDGAVRAVNVKNIAEWNLFAKFVDRFDKDVLCNEIGVNPGEPQPGWWALKGTLPPSIFIPEFSCHRLQPTDVVMEAVKNTSRKPSTRRVKDHVPIETAPCDREFGPM